MGNYTAMPKSGESPVKVEVFFGKVAWSVSCPLRNGPAIDPRFRHIHLRKIIFLFR